MQRTTFRQRAEHFDISGFVNSRKEMWDAIRDWGPSGTGSRLIVGTAQPRFGYSYKFKKQGGRCYVQDLKVTVGVVLRLPEWNAKGLAKPELQRYFDCILRTVTVHEKRHGKIAYETGQQIERALVSELDGSACKGYKARANSHLSPRDCRRRRSAKVTLIAGTMRVDAISNVTIAMDLKSI